jgi:hypothetical protein
MNSKSIIWIGMFIGSTIGGFIPNIWGGGIFSTIIFSGIGGIAGIWIGFKLSH